MQLAEETALAQLHSKKVLHQKSRRLRNRDNLISWSWSDFEPWWWVDFVLDNSRIAPKSSCGTLPGDFVDKKIVDIMSVAGMLTSWELSDRQI